MNDKIKKIIKLLLPKIYKSIKRDGMDEAFRGVVKNRDMLHIYEDELGNVFEIGVISELDD